MTLVLRKCSGTITKLIRIQIPRPSITARRNADAAQHYPRDSQAFVKRGGKRKKTAQCFPNTELTDPSWKGSLNCEGDTLLCLSFLRLCQWGNGNKGISVWVTFQSRISVSCSPINCHKVIAGWCASAGIPFLARWQLCSMLYGRVVAEPSWQAVPVAALSPHLLPPPKHPSTPAGSQEDTEQRHD